MTAAAALFPMAALAPSSGNCFSGNSSSSSMSSRRPSKGSHSHSPQRSPSESQKQWQEAPPADNESDSQQQQSVDVRDAAATAAASESTNVAPLRVCPVKQGTQQPVNLVQRGLGASTSALRPPVTSKTSSLLQRKQQFYKTKMCPWFSRGRCDRGSSCQFAHSNLELRATPDLRRTSLCPRLKQLGRCCNRDCSYAHQPQELRATGEVYKTALCVKWQLGRCAVGNLCRHAHGPEDMRGVVVAAAVSSKRGTADSTATAALTAPTAAAAAAAPGLGGLAKIGGGSMEACEGDRSSRSSLGSSTGNAVSSSNSTCTSSPAPCPSPYSFTGTSAAVQSTEASGDAGQGETTSAVGGPLEVLPDLDQEAQPAASRQQLSELREQQQQQQHCISPLAGALTSQGTSWTAGCETLSTDYPLPQQNAVGWDQQQQQGHLAAQHGKGLMQQRQSPSSQKPGALLPLSRKLPKGFSRQLRQQHQHQQLLLLQSRQGRFNHKDMQQQPQQQHQQNMQLQAVQGGHKRRPSQQQQQQPQQHHQSQPQQPLYSWTPRQQRLQWNGVQQQQQQQRHQLLQQPLDGNPQHFHSQQHHVPPDQILLLPQQHQHPQSVALQETLWQQQNQQHHQPLAQGHPPFEQGLVQDIPNPLVQQQQQQPKTDPYNPELSQQQQQPHTWEPQGLLSLWEQPDLCCWTGNTGPQQSREDAAAACGAAPFVDHRIDDRLLLLQQHEIGGGGNPEMSHQQPQLGAPMETKVESGATDATPATAEGAPPLSTGDSPAAAGAARPVPLQAPDSAQISHVSQESPCSILFSGPKLFNVAADGGDLQD